MQFIFILLYHQLGGTPNRPIELKPPLSETHNHGPLEMLRSQGKPAKFCPERANSAKNRVYDHVYKFDMWLVKMLTLIKHKITPVNSDLPLMTKMR